MNGKCIAYLPTYTTALREFRPSTPIHKNPLPRRLRHHPLLPPLLSRRIMSHRLRRDLRRTAHLRIHLQRPRTRMSRRRIDW